jgi:basic amino acid/polyamine antiporter, APA family
LSPATSGSADQRLKRAISGPQFFAVSFGCIVGVGWIVVMGGIVGQAGAGGTAIALALGGLGVLLVAMCYAEMAARMPAAGGELVYANVLGGSLGSYVTGWTLALIYTITCAFEAISIGQLVALLFPGITGPTLYTMLGQPVTLGGIAAGFAAALILWAVNVRGVRGSARAQEYVTYGRMALMVVFLGVAMVYAEPANLTPLVRGNGSNGQMVAILAALATAPFWFGGFNVVASAVEESSTSPAVLARALLLSIVAAAIFYILLVLSVSALVPSEQLVKLELPAAQAFEIALGSATFAKIVLVTALLGNLTAWNALLVAGSRVLFALSRARLLPAPLAQVSDQSSVPVNAITMISLVSIFGLFLGRGYILPVVNISSAAFGFTYLVTCVALLRLRADGLGAPGYLVPGGRPTIIIAALVSAAITVVALIQPWFATKAGMPPEWLTLLGWGLLSALVWLFIRKDVRRTGEDERRALLAGQNDQGGNHA